MKTIKFRLAESLLKLSLLFSPPVLVFFILGRDATIPMMFLYLGFIVSWIGIELKIRDLALRSLEIRLRHEPLFEARLESDKSTGHEDRATKMLYIRNISANPAYGIRRGRIRDIKNRPLCSPTELETFSERCEPNLGPQEEICLLPLDETIIQNQPTVEVSYYSQGDLRWILIQLLSENKALVVRQEERRQGILLNTFEEFSGLLRRIRFTLKMRGKWDRAKWYVGYNE